MVGQALWLALFSQSDSYAELPTPAELRVDSYHSWTVTREEIEARGYDLTAVNPNEKGHTSAAKPKALSDLRELSKLEDRFLCWQRSIRTDAIEAEVWERVFC